MPGPRTAGLSVSWKATTNGFKGKKLPSVSSHWGGSSIGMNTFEMNPSGRIVALATAAADRALGIRPATARPSAENAAHADEERDDHRRHLGGVDLEVVGHDPERQHDPGTDHRQHDAEPTKPARYAAGGNGVPRQRLSTPSSRRIGTMLARLVYVALTAVNAASPPV